MQPGNLFERLSSSGAWPVRPALGAWPPDAPRLGNPIVLEATAAIAAGLRSKLVGRLLGVRLGGCERIIAQIISLESSSAHPAMQLLDAVVRCLRSVDRDIERGQPAENTAASPGGTDEDLWDALDPDDRNGVGFRCSWCLEEGYESPDDVVRHKRRDCAERHRNFALGNPL